MLSILLLAFVDVFQGCHFTTICWEVNCKQRAILRWLIVVQEFPQRLLYVDPISTEESTLDYDWF